MRLSNLLVAAGVLFATVAGHAQDASSPQSGYEGVVKPSKEVVLKPPVEGRIASLLVEEGETVSGGDHLTLTADNEKGATTVKLRVEGLRSLPLEKGAKILIGDHTEIFTVTADPPAIGDGGTVEVKITPALPAAAEGGEGVETLLARMNDAVQQKRLAAAELRAQRDAERKRAKASLAEAKLRLKQIREAFEKNAANKSEVQRRRYKRDQAAAQLDAAEEQAALSRASLALERTKLERYRITAPFDGQVVRIRAEAGAAMIQNDPIMKIAKLDPLEAKFTLPIEVYGELERGKTYRLVPAENAPVQKEALSGRLKTVSPLIQYASETFRCVFTIQNPGRKLPAGFSVTLDRAAVGKTAKR